MEHTHSERGQAVLNLFAIFGLAAMLALGHQAIDLGMLSSR